MQTTDGIRRQEAILQLLDREGECQIRQLAAELNVSEMTVRRDLGALENEGKLIRTHGGATAAAGVRFEFGFLRRANENLEAKEEIGAIASSLVTGRQSVILDSSTTTLAIAKRLRKHEDLTVITTSLPIASELQYCENIDLILLGGRLRRDTPDLAGALTLQALGCVHADVAFLGCDAVDASGVAYSSSVDVAHLIRAMAAASTRVYVVADSSKVGRADLGTIGVVSEWDGLISDSGLSDEMSRRLRELGVTVLTTERNGGGTLNE